MKKTNRREVQRLHRHNRIRKISSGTKERPRLCIHRSLKNLSVQVIDDLEHKVLMGMSTLDKGVHAQEKNGGNVKAATALGEAFAAKAKDNGITKVCFDRGGYKYHGRVKAFADAARQGGLEF